MTAAELAGDAMPGQYKHVEPIDRDRHRNLGISIAARNRFASGLNTARLNLAEFFHAMMNYPIAFVRQDAEPYKDRYAPCAVLGMAQGENLFVEENGSWIEGMYCPAFVRRYPFVTAEFTDEELASSESGLSRPVYVDTAGLERDAESLFDANGEPTRAWRETDSFLSDYMTAEKATMNFTDRLDALGLLEPFDAQIHPTGGEMVRLKGLYRVSENRLNGLPAKAVADLMKTGRLSRIYAHLISLENFAKLLDRSASKTARK